MVAAMLKSVPCLWLHAWLTLSASLHTCFVQATELICFTCHWEPGSALLPPNVAWRMDRPQPWYQHTALPGPGTAELFGGSSGSLCSLCSRLGKEGVHGELLLPLLPPLAVKRKGCWMGLSCQFCYYKLFQCSVAPEHWVVSSPPVPLGAGRAVFVTVSCEVLLPGERLVGAFLASSPVLMRLEHCWLSGAGCFMGLCVPPWSLPLPFRVCMPPEVFLHWPSCGHVLGSSVPSA